MQEPTPPSLHGARSAEAALRPQGLPTHPLVSRLLAVTHGAEVRPQTVEAFEAAAGDAVVFFGGDPVRFPEALDVAVVLPELIAAAGRPVRVGVVPRDCEDAVARRYAVQRWPTLVFLRDGGYLGALSGMQDWQVYVAALREVLAREPGRRPAPTIAIHAAGATGCH
ncbi:MAG: hydrogenase [Rubrivivax sp.]|nr:hydrogenase [Rubrivivax sp.]